MLVRALLTLALAVSTVAPTGAAEQSLANTIKRILSTPTPTPKPRKKKSSSTTKRPSPSPAASPKKKPSPTNEESPAPSVTPSIKKKKPSASPSLTPSLGRKKKSSPTPELTATPEGSKSPSVTPSPTVTPESSSTPAPTSPVPKKHGAPNATLTPDAIKGFENYPANVQKLLVSALELTTRNLDYKYGSADPATGGMDCSGFVYFVLKQNGVEDVPRDSSEQYVWLRRSRRFEAVLSQQDNSFELEDLKPGDLLFWIGTYSIERDPPITHAMIYLGRENKTGQRVMVGASDGRVYQGESRNGVSVFDFKVQRNGKADDGKLRPTFIGYGHIPGLRE